MNKEANLVNYHISDLKFTNHLNGPAKLELTYRYSYNVGYSQQNTCRGELRAEIADKKAPDKFSLDVTLLGMFTTQPGVQKEVLHLKTYDMLFPYLKALVSTMTATAGVPPVYIPYIDISDKSIIKFEMPHGED